ncbi:hypothetical protein ACWDRB_47140 [Nonomuraea sp. NPDC003707]
MLSNAIGVFLPLVTALNVRTPATMRWEVTSTPDASPDGTTSLEAYTLRKVMTDGTPRDGRTGFDLHDDIVDTLLETLNEQHGRPGSWWYSSGPDRDLRDPEQPRTVAYIEFWRLTDAEAYKADLLDEEMPEPGHVPTTVTFDFEETRVC